MFARLSVGVAGLAVMVLGGLAGAAALAQSPTPTPIPVGCDFPTPTPGETPYPGSTATAAPAAPTDLRAELVADPELVGGFAVQLSWQDNADNETCYQVMVRIDAEPLTPHGGFVPYDASTTGPQTLKDTPDRTGLHCYQVYYGNSAGRSYSNEACIDVESLPRILSPTPTPAPVGCDFPTPAPGPGATPFPWPTASVPPAAPSDLRAELVPDRGLEAGFAVELTWQDNADNDACHFMEVRIDGELKRGWGAMLAEGGSATGANTSRDIPDRTGMHCYRIYYGNSAGRAYSNEACVSVEVLPVRVTATPIVPTTYPPVTATPPAESPTATGPTVIPTPPPWPCELEDPPYSELGPAAPTNLVATLIADASVSSGYRVELIWKDNATDVLCFKAQSRLADGTWHWFTGGTGSAEIAVDGAALPGECYRVWVANEHGRSAYSNEACATGPAITRTATSTPAGLHATPAATAVLAQAAAVGALPATGDTDGGGLAWWWWAVAATGSAAALATAVGLAWVARHKR